MKNERTLSGNLLNLGRIHWVLVRASSLLQSEQFEDKPDGSLEIPARKESDRKFKRDPIAWWVFEGEHDIPALKKKTADALSAAQILKDASVDLGKAKYRTLKELRDAYVQFGEKNQQEIEAILNYAEWLKSRNEFAPAILYNYRTWGTTRMALRKISADPRSFDTSKVVVTGALIVLGLIINEIPVAEWIRLDLEQKTSAAQIEQRAVALAIMQFTEYFAQLRDSLRNIQLDIEKREDKERLLTSDDFWRSFILKASRSPKTESKYWDFKQTLDIWHIKNEPAKSEKAKQFAEIVSGFGNNQGGVIIVGVTDTAPRRIVGLSGDIENNLKHARNVISQYIPHDRDFVHFQQVNVLDQNGDSKLCLVIVVQQTAMALSVRGPDGKSFSYPFREESGLIWKDQNTIGNNKLRIKSDNYDFLSVLRQFVNEEI